MDDKKGKDSAMHSDIREKSLVSAIVRKSFRVSLKESDALAVIINKRSYPLQDISRTGVSINLPSDTIFSVGQHCANCTLNISGSRITDLEAYVVHCSPGQDGKWLYGVQWINLSDDAQKKIDDLVVDLKKKKFTKDSFDSTDFESEL